MAINVFKSLQAAVLLLSFSSFAIGSGSQNGLIDRHALVTRHNFVLTSFDGDHPVQVGNGEFAFGMDITGLQTFAPFNTMSHWGWHSSPLPAGEKVENFHGDVVETHGRPVRYPLADPNHPELSAWLAGNPHRINLGRLGFLLKKKDGSPAAQADIRRPRQEMDLWNGLVTSHFELEGVPVTVVTACHPSIDQIAVRVESPLVQEGRLAVFLDCPGDSTNQFDNYVGDWSNRVLLVKAAAAQKHRADFVRPLGEDSYHISLTWQGDALLQPPATGGPSIEIIRAEYGAGDKWLDVTDIAKKAVRNGRLTLRAGNTLGKDPAHGVVKQLRVQYTVYGKPLTASAAEGENLVIDPIADERRYRLQPTKKSTALAFTCTFSPKPIPVNLPTSAATFDDCRVSWPAYWKSGGAIDLSGSKDPRWMELERRIVLSQYLMAVNEAGSLPPQESGLVNNGWFGRFHMEMYWWHAAHWALWNRWPELNRSLGIYSKLMKEATQTASREGYAGARWPKCIGPNFVEWPFTIHSWLIWQQPHPIFFADLDYRAHPTRATLEKWKPVVEATADFMASYAFHDEATHRYVLGPPVFLASENTDPLTTQNPTYELAYWRFGLRTAIEWRQRLGLQAKPEWSRVLNGLAPLPVQEGVYVLHEGVEDMWTKWNFEHPALTSVFGILPGDGVDKETTRRTLDKVASTWNFDRTWGWDYPMLAMCAARLGEPDRAIDFLLTDKPGFQFDVRGLASGGPFPYFPSNGGLLYAAAFMAAGWDGAPKSHAPGFPNNGRWKVRYEGLNVAP